MRLKVRRSVDLPQRRADEGRHSASGMASVMCLRAWNLPYHTLRSFTAILWEDRQGSSRSCCSDQCWSCSCLFKFGSMSAASVSAGAAAFAQDDGAEAHQEDERDEDERGAVLQVAGASMFVPEVAIT
mgnify:CR=1 FL=1